MNLTEQQLAITEGSLTPSQVAEAVLQRANSNAGKNVYLQLDAEHVRQQARQLEQSNPQTRGPLFGVPISIKDCFDVQGFRTSCGSSFYNASDPVMSDSWMASRIHASGALLIGKTHLHQLAYGITGENVDFGDCVQPRDASLLTGGSSSGAAASVQEGSAMVAIGTDTGGSIRVPAALCGLAGYRSSIGIGSWEGGAHLAPTFDTLGLLFKDLRDGPAFASALLGIDCDATNPHSPAPRIAVINGRLLEECDNSVNQAYADLQRQMARSGATFQKIDIQFWDEAIEIFAAIQAHEASGIHRRKLAGRADFDVFEAAIAARLTWGEALTQIQIEQYRLRHAKFQATMDSVLRGFDFLLMPCMPSRQLRAGEDQTEARGKILRYTAPVSLACMPAVTIPGANGLGMQLVAARGDDARLLSYAAQLHVDAM